jgi:hypothetical protein
VLTKGEKKNDDEEVHSTTTTTTAATTTTSSGLTATTTTSPYISHCAFQFQWVNKLRHFNLLLPIVLESHFKQTVFPNHFHVADHKIILRIN